MFLSLKFESIFFGVLVVLLVLPTTQSLATNKPSSSPNTNSLFALNLECTVRPEFREDWLKQIKEDQLCSRRDEPDCLQFVLGQDVDDENKFYLFELYRNANAFQHQCQTPHFKAYGSFVDTNQPFVGEPKLCFYHPLDEDDSSSASTTEKRPIHKNAFGLNVNLYPKASVKSEFLEVISNNKKGTDTTEPLALQYTYGEATAAPGESSELDDNLAFHFHEQYSGDNHGKEGFDAHASTPHFAAWEDFVKTEPFEKAPEVSFFHILES